jgi:hypothetical protein
MTDKLQARIRQDDKIIREHFSNIKKSDHPYELRRLVEKAIVSEQKEKELLEEVQKQHEQDS